MTWVKHLLVFVCAAAPVAASVAVTAFRNLSAGDPEISEGKAKDDRIGKLIEETKNAAEKRRRLK